MAAAIAKLRGIIVVINAKQQGVIMPQVRISWEDTVQGESVFEIYRTHDPNVVGTIIGTVPVDIKTFIDPSPQVGQNWYQVRGKNSAGSIPWSSWASVVIPAITGEITAIRAEIIP